MKKFTCLLIPLLFTLLNLIQIRVLAQGPPLERDCFYQTEDDCFVIGYQSVTPRLNEPNRLDVEVIFRSSCGNVTDIRVNPIIGTPVIATAADITGEVQTAAFIVNSNAFENDNTLRFTIDFTDGSRTMVDIFFDETIECGAIIPLPVELTSFKGKATESGITLNWETASELNNSHFDIERSTDGETFSSIGTIPGNGTTSIPSSYSFVDELPGKGTNYYRLKQVDYDNAQSYSSTIAVSWDAGNAMQAALVPNPCANSNCNITISNAANQSTLLQLKDVAGRVVFSRTINSSGHLFELPMHELPKLKGLYFLTATTGNQVVHQRVVLE